MTPRARAAAGFTLLEVLVVVTILGLAAAIGYATLDGDDRGLLDREARRFAGALEFAAQRAQLRHETLGVSAHGNAVRFWTRSDDGRWAPLSGDDALAPHTLRAPVVSAAVTYAGREVPLDAVLPLRASGRNEPFAFVLRAGAYRATITADPLNRVAVLGPVVQ